MRERIVFLPDYDIAMATMLYPGCDVWLNNPIRPLEASGTSGMKAALNGALNLSILDGWWDEWFDGENGWAIPTADGIEDADRRDDLEAEALYYLIENSRRPGVLHPRRRRPPAALDGDGPAHPAHPRPEGARQPHAPRVRHAAVHAGGASPRASSRRTTSRVARDLAAWKKRVRAEWPAIRIDHVEADGVGDAVMLGTPITVRAFVSLGELTPDDVVVQAVYGRVDADDRIIAPVHAAMEPVEQYDGNRWQYRLVVDARQQRPVRLHRPGPAAARRARGARGAGPAGRAGAVGRPRGRRPALVATPLTVARSARAGARSGRRAWLVRVVRGDGLMRPARGRPAGCAVSGSRRCRPGARRPTRWPARCACR